ncbi:hypothetical protein Zm00014a_012400 [Zea mays]|uniref:Uncharacterized protein n=1 Tax=Zea mays TaxID=4577 RepID=A0A3L6FIT4_MAIZE|nr:hypothetical protein Zm00014a_012400 [Zea mays]
MLTTPIRSQSSLNFSRLSDFVVRMSANC